MFGPAAGFQRAGNFLVGHEQPSAQVGAVILDHHHNRFLIDGEVAALEPVTVEIEGVLESKITPEPRTGRRERWP